MPIVEKPSLPTTEAKQHTCHRSTTNTQDEKLNRMLQRLCENKPGYCMMCGLRGEGLRHVSLPRRLNARAALAPHQGVPAFMTTVRSLRKCAPGNCIARTHVFMPLAPVAGCYGQGRPGYERREQCPPKQHGCTTCTSHARFHNTIV